MDSARAAPQALTYLQRATACPLSKWDKAREHCRWCNADLRGRQQKWCSRECSEAYGRNHWWTQAREAAKERDGHRCLTCGEAERLEVNHISPVLGDRRSGCKNHLDNLETLCHRCHCAVTLDQIRKIADCSLIS